MISSDRVKVDSDTTGVVAAVMIHQPDKDAELIVELPFTFRVSPGATYDIMCVAPSGKYTCNQGIDTNWLENSNYKVLYVSFGKSAMESMCDAAWAARDKVFSTVGSIIKKEK